MFHFGSLCDPDPIALTVSASFPTFLNYIIKEGKVRTL